MYQPSLSEYFSHAFPVYEDLSSSNIELLNLNLSDYNEINEKVGLTFTDSEMLIRQRWLISHVSGCLGLAYSGFFFF
jgi:hypothetical protein